jgi:hypothetical protein
MPSPQTKHEPSSQLGGLGPDGSLGVVAPAGLESELVFALLAPQPKQATSNRALEYRKMVRVTSYAYHDRKGICSIRNLPVGLSTTAR